MRENVFSTYISYLFSLGKKCMTNVSVLFYSRSWRRQQRKPRVNPPSSRREKPDQRQPCESFLLSRSRNPSWETRKNPRALEEKGKKKICGERTWRLIFDAQGRPQQTRAWPRAERSPSDACLLYTSPSPRDLSTSRMPSSA